MTRTLSPAPARENSLSTTYWSESTLMSSRRSSRTCLVFGAWCAVFGVWCLVFGVWGVVFGVWGLGLRIEGRGAARRHLEELMLHGRLGLAGLCRASLGARCPLFCRLGVRLPAFHLRQHIRHQSDREREAERERVRGRGREGEGERASAVAARSSRAMACASFRASNARSSRPASVSWCAPYSRLIDSCITQRKAQGPSLTRVKKKKKGVWHRSGMEGLALSLRLKDLLGPVTRVKKKGV